jgi:hypothetical protein
MKRAHVLGPVSLLVIALIILPACNSLNPACGSARPRPIIGSLSVTTVPFTQVQQSFVLDVYGAQFDSSSVGQINGTSVTTLVISSTHLQATLTSSVISGPGTFNVTVNTPSGNTGNLGCTSGGTTAALVLTVT